MLGQQGSLVKYSTPVLVSSSGKGQNTKKNSKQQEKHHMENILGVILPPKQHRTDNGQLWVQTVLSTPATKNQVIQLSEQLNKRLIQKQARQVGLCPVRQELFDQCFDQVIRQITIDCRQRGILLVRVRDEYRNQIGTYKKLYESSLNHGMRRVIESDKKKQKMSNQIAKLQKQCAELERSVNDLNIQIRQTRALQQNKLKMKQQKHLEKTNEIKENNQKLKIQIQSALQKSK